jgi:hypothetical protein
VNKRNLVGLTILFLFLGSLPAQCQTNLPASLEGVVVGVGSYQLLLQSVTDGNTKLIFTNEQGRYKVDIPPGRYRIRLLGKYKFPIMQERSPFNILSSENLKINFTSIPVGINSGLVESEYISRYNDNNLPISITYYFSSLQRVEMQEVKILCQTMESSQGVSIFTNAFVSYEHFFLHASEIIYDEREKIITAKSNSAANEVLLENGFVSEKHKEVSIKLGSLDYQVKK